MGEVGHTRPEEVEAVRVRTVVEEAFQPQVVVGAAQRMLAVQLMVRLMLAAQQMPVVDVLPRSPRKHT